MKRLGYVVQMSYDISDEEKTQAEKALIAFNHTLKKLKVAKEHLNVMLTPFKDHPDISSEEIFNFRVQIRDFRDQIIENFNDFKASAFKCIVLMQRFSSDTQTVKLMKSFITSIDSIENKVNNFAELFSDLKSKDFVQKATASIASIKKECEEIENIINDRLISHIRENILSKTWIDNINNELQDKLKPSKPLVVELFNQRQEEFNNKIK